MQPQKQKVAKKEPMQSILNTNKKFKHKKLWAFFQTNSLFVEFPVKYQTNKHTHAQKAHRNKTRKRVGKIYIFSMFGCVCVCLFVTNILNLEGNRNRMQKQIVSYSTEKTTCMCHFQWIHPNILIIWVNISVYCHIYLLYILDSLFFIVTFGNL